MDNNIIEVEDVYKTYGDEVETEVLHGVSFSLLENDFAAIIGPSGSGKSTLLNLIAALDKPTRGKVFISGEDITQLDENKLADLRNEKLGFVFQFHHLLPEFTALENVLMPVWISQGKPTREDEEWAEKLIDTVGMTPWKDNLSTKLSGGQKQRIAIARSLMNKPGVILADEPTGNLDTDTSEQVFKLLRNINQEFGTVFVIVTHDRHLAGRTDKIIEIVDGNIVRTLSGSKTDEFEVWDEMAPGYCVEHKKKVEV